MATSRKEWERDRPVRPALCNECGRIHEACSQHDQEGRPCPSTRIPVGATKCRDHGGQPSRAQLRQHAAELADDDMDDPAEVAMRLMTASNRRQLWYSKLLKEQVKQAGSVDALIGRELIPTGDGGVVEGRDYIRALVDLEYRERVFASKQAMDLLKAEIYKRRAEAVKEHATDIVEIIDQIVAGLNATPEQLAQVPQVAQEVLAKMTQPNPRES